MDTINGKTQLRPALNLQLLIERLSEEVVEPVTHDRIVQILKELEEK